MLPNLTLGIVLLLSYLLGSLPTSLLAGRMARSIDIREHGSGNAGATNVYRVLGLKWALVVAFVDVLKGTAAVLLIARIHWPAVAPLDPTTVQLLAGGAAVCGHVWTILAGFHGGKGVATAVGALTPLAPTAMAAAMGVWIILLLTVRIMSVASVGAAIVLPVAVWIWEVGPDGTAQPDLTWATVLLAVLIIFTHRGNLIRLLRGEEKGIGSPAGKVPAASERTGKEPAGDAAGRAP